MRSQCCVVVVASILQVVLAVVERSAPPKAVLGGFFNEDAFMERAFSLAVRTINKCAYDNEICEMIHKNDDGVNVRLFHQVEIAAVAFEVDDDLMSIHDKFGEIAGANGGGDDDGGGSRNNNRRPSATAAKQLGLSTVIGPHERVPSIYMQGLCGSHDIPNIVIRRDHNLEHNPTQTINLYPDTKTMANVYIQMIKRMKWESFSILYQDTDNLIALQDVLKMYPPFTHEIRAYKLGAGPNFSEPLLTAKGRNLPDQDAGKNAFSRHTSFLLDCEYDVLPDLLIQAQQLGMMSETYRWLVTSLDLQVIDSWPFRYSGANITGLSLVDPEDPFVSEFVGAHLDEFGIESVDKLRHHDALMFDAVALFAQGYKDFVYANPGGRYGAKVPKDYTRPRHSWVHGLSLRNYVLYNALRGLSGPLTIDPDGVRRRFKLDVLNIQETGIERVGSWDPDRGFDDLQLAHEIAVEHFRVLITINPPYAVRVNHSEIVSGNARYEGFVVDIIKELAQMMHFNYTLYVQENSDNGNCTKNWKTDQCVCSGMMGKLLNNEMDLAITDLTITENRAACIQFSAAFWNLGMSILYKKPQKAKPSWYSFLLPFSSDVWMYLGLIWVLISILFSVFSRLSPPEWTNPYPCIDEPTELENQFSIDNAFWFTIGTLLQQGTELAPIGISTRCLAGWWWFFCLIITNSYTANLAAFLTGGTPVVIIKSIDDLVNQTKITYGAKKGGSTFTYFASSTDPRHKQLYEQMIDPEWMKKWIVGTNDMGIQLAKSDEVNYAFFTESPTIEYVQHRICNLEQAGGLIDHKTYAIGFAKDFKYAKELDLMLAKLNENSVIKALYRKWWSEKGAVCTDDESNEATSMTLEQLVGDFYVLCGGCMIAFVVTSYEFLRGVRATAKTDGVRFMDTFLEELKFIKGGESIKTVTVKKRKSSENNCSDNHSCNLTMTTQT